MDPSIWNTCSPCLMHERDSVKHVPFCLLTSLTFGHCCILELWSACCTHAMLVTVVHCRTLECLLYTCDIGHCSALQNTGVLAVHMRYWSL
jgi:hypothetical protein